MLVFRGVDDLVAILFLQPHVFFLTGWDSKAELPEKKPLFLGSLVLLLDKTGRVVLPWYQFSVIYECLLYP